MKMSFGHIRYLEDLKIAKISNKLYYYFQRNESIMGNAYNLKRLDALEAKRKGKSILKDIILKWQKWQK